MIWLKDVIKSLEQIKEKASEEFLGMDPEELVWKPSPKSWSIAECLKHLIIANELYLTDINDRLNKSEVKTMEKPIRFTLTGRIFLYFVDPKYKIKVPAPALFKPEKQPKKIDGQKTVAHFLDLQDRLITTADKAYGYDHSKLITVSPLSNLLQFNIGEQFYIMMRHEKRHLNQAKRVKDQLQQLENIKE